MIVNRGPGFTKCWLDVCRDYCSDVILVTGDTPASSAHTSNTFRILTLKARKLGNVHAKNISEGRARLSIGSCSLRTYCFSLQLAHAPRCAPEELSKSERELQQCQFKEKSEPTHKQRHVTTLIACVKKRTNSRKYLHKVLVVNYFMQSRASCCIQETQLYIEAY